MMIPKSLLSLLMVVAATFSVAATDLFHFEDFDMHPGETVLVEILLDNEAQYTAFQADLYLPDGLTVDRQSVALTSRKAADHSIATSVLSDGAIRLMSYSMMVQPYSGNNGALVTLQVTAGESLSNPVVIGLKNCRFTSLEGQETTLPDTSCMVSFYKRGDANCDGNVNISDVTVIINKLLNGTASLVSLKAIDVNCDGNVNISDVTALINVLLSGQPLGA